MSDNSGLTAIRELTKTVLVLQERIISLEKTVLQQNSMIKLLVGDRQISSDTENLILSDAVEGTGHTGGAAPVNVKRPVREARVRARAALKLNVKAPKAKGITSPRVASLSTARAVTGLAIPGISSSRSAPATPSALSLSPACHLSAVPTLQVADVNKQIIAQPAATIAPLNTDNVVDNNNTDWVEVSRRRRSRAAPTNVTRGTATPGSNVCALAAAERKSYLHLYFLQSGTTTEQVLDHLKTICPNDKCAAEALKSRGDYASFKLTVPTRSVDVYRQSEHWATDVCVKPWRSGFRSSQHAGEK